MKLSIKDGKVHVSLREDEDASLKVTTLFAGPVETVQCVEFDMTRQATRNTTRWLDCLAEMLEAEAAGTLELELPTGDSDEG